MSQTPRPAILITVISSSITETRIVHNLEKALQKESRNFDCQHKYFYWRINILKTDDCQNILNSKITLLKHV
jgi:hypothetical protein